MQLSPLRQALERWPRAQVAHLPTRIERLRNLSGDWGMNLWVKRDDATGFAMGGNKIRQLEYYIGDALAKSADTVLITGAVQSNFVRATTAFAAKFNLACHVQLEERVVGVSGLYRKSGNAFLDRLFGAKVHSFPVGEDESAADHALQELAEELATQGNRPYVIHLGAEHPPIGALGYIGAAIELADQLQSQAPPDAIYVASGSASTHCGLLFGLRALGIDIPVIGICVRRAASIQRERVYKRCHDLAALLDVALPFEYRDVVTDDRSFGEGYGQLTQPVKEAVETSAKREGMLIDTVYTGPGHGCTQGPRTEHRQAGAVLAYRRRTGLVCLC